MDPVDVLIVGGGPVGLFGATLAGLHGMRVKIVEALPQLGGQLTVVYPEKLIYDVAGFRAIRAQALVDMLVEQALDYEPEIFTGERVEQLARDEEGILEVTTSRGMHRARIVLLTAGIGSFAPHPVPAEGVEWFGGVIESPGP